MYRIFILLALLSLVSCRKDSTVVSIVKDDFSVSEQRSFGEAIDEHFSEHLLILDATSHPEAYRYVQTFYDMLINTPSVQLRDSMEWNVHIFEDNSMKRIFTSPTGNLYITVDLLKFLQSENELLALLGQQIYFIESGASFNLIKNNNDAIEIGKVVVGETSSQIPNMANSLKYAPFSKQVLLGADSFSVSLICPFNYNPTNAIDIYNIQPEMISDLSQNLPWYDERAITIINEAQQCGEQDSVYTLRYELFKETLPE